MQTANWSPFVNIGFPEYGLDNYLESARQAGLWERITDHARYTPEYVSRMLHADKDRRILLDPRYRIRSVEADVKPNPW